MILKLMSSLLNSSTSNTSKALKSRNGHGHFLADMLKALHTSQEKSFSTRETPSGIRTISNGTHTSSNKIRMSSDNKGCKFYLETLKNELLAYGKPLNKIFLKENDLPLIKKFLFQCGFSPDKIEDFLSELKASNPTGEISFSKLFLKITELDPPKNNEQQNDTVPLSALPYIESVLRDFDFTPKELESVFSASRVEGGDLNLNKFVAKLREINAKRPSAHSTVIDQKPFEENSKMMEMFGIQMENKGRIGRISLEHFIASLERITGNVNPENKLPPEIKGILDNILEKVKLTEQKPISSPSVRVSSNYDFTNPLMEEKIGAKGNPVLNEKTTSSLGKNKSGQDEAKFSFHKQNDHKVIRQVQPNIDTTIRGGKGDSSSDLGRKIEFIKSVKESSYPIKAEIGQGDGPRNTANFNLTDAVKTAESGEKTFRGYLPASLVEQVGKQISRSILRGDQVLRLQLKPPELGRVKIEIDIKDHTLKLAMMTDHNSVRELLLNNVHELKEALIQQGVKLEKLDVQINYNFDQSLNGSKEGMDNRHEGRQGFSGNQLPSDHHTEDQHARSIYMVSEDNLLDLVA